MSGVLYVSNFLSSGAANRGYCEDLADRLESAGSKVFRTSTRPRQALRLADMLYTAWSRRALYDVALVDVFSGLAFVWAEAVCFELRRLRRPYVLTLHGGMLPEFARAWPRRVQRLLRSARAVTAPSNYLRTAMSCYRDDIALIPNAIDTLPYSKRDSRHGARLIWVRAFHELYNPTLAVEVLAIVKRSHPTATLTMLGPDKGDGSRAAVSVAAERLGVADQLEVVGPVPKADVARYLAAADVLLNTTNVDNTPISLLEAMAAQLPIVSTSVGGIPFLVDDQHTGLLVPPRDPYAMAAAVNRILEQPMLRAQIADNARAFAARSDWSIVTSMWQRLLEGITSDG